MALENPDSEDPSLAPSGVGQSATTAEQDETLEAPKKTVQSALALLESLQPQITSILSGEGVDVPLEVLDVFPPGSWNSNVLWLGPAPSAPRRRARAQTGPNQTGDGGEGVGDAENKLRLVSGEFLFMVNKGRANWRVDLVHQAFKKEGYITDRRALKVRSSFVLRSCVFVSVREFGFSVFLSSNRGAPALPWFSCHGFSMSSARRGLGCQRPMASGRVSEWTRCTKSLYHVECSLLLILSQLRDLFV